MSGVPLLDFSPIGDLGKVYDDARQKAQRDAILSSAPTDGSMQSLASLGMKLIQSGDMQGGLALAHMADAASRDARDFGLRKDEIQRNQSNADRAFGFQEKQADPATLAARERATQTVQAEFAPKTVDVKRVGPLGDTVTETMQKGPNGFAPLPTASGSVQNAAPGTGATPAVTGPDYLKTLPTPLASLVQKVANYEISPSLLSTKGGHRENIMAAASQYDPNFDAALAPARFAAVKEFNSGGPNSPAGTFTSGNTAIQHLKVLSDISQKIGGASNWGVLNSALNQGNVALQGMKNSPDLAEYNNALGRFAEEATKFYRGVGGSESDIQRALQDISAAQSPEARDRAIATQAELMASKIDALQSRWKQATGPAGWNKIAKDFPIVQPKSAEGLDVIMTRAGKPAYSKGTAEPGATPQAPGAAPPAQDALPRVASPADAAKLPKGTRFLDPNGVERIVP